MFFEISEGEKLKIRVSTLAVPRLRRVCFLLTDAIGAEKILVWRLHSAPLCNLLSQNFAEEGFSPSLALPELWALLPCLG